jgi:hypothetical protein
MASPKQCCMTSAVVKVVETWAMETPRRMLTVPRMDRVA